MAPVLSVVAPLYNESENVAPLVDWILEALAAYPESYEVSGRIFSDADIGGAAASD